ncbi:MAG: hypothetical protein AAF483_29825 [Planctomycetota bacterium]
MQSPKKKGDSIEQEIVLVFQGTVPSKSYDFKSVELALATEIEWRI